jgi:hypothetical protein
LRSIGPFITEKWFRLNNPLGKSNEFQILAHEFDLLCFTETHLDASFTNNQLLPVSMKMQIHRNDRNQFGGGVLVAVRDSLLHYIIRLDLECYPIEALAILIPAQQSFVTDLIVMCVYIPPSQISKAIKPLDAVMEFLDKKYPIATKIIVGDFNMPDIDWKTMSVRVGSQRRVIHQAFMHFLIENNLSQIVTEPTHVQGNILDLVLTDDMDRVQNMSIVNPGLSDHYMLEFKINEVKRNWKPFDKKINLYSKADSSSIRHHLALTLQKVEKAVEENQNIDTVWNIFELDLSLAVSSFVPSYTIKQRNCHEPLWFNSVARRAVRQQRSIYNRYKKFKLESLLRQYTDLRRENKKLFRKMEYAYFMDKICDPLEDGQSKPFYSYIKQQRGRTGASVGFSRGTKQNCTLPETADTFNTFFNSVFHARTPTPQINEIGTNICVTEEGVKRLVKDLKRGKAPGPDTIRREHLHLDLLMVTKILTLIFQHSINLMEVPNNWKMANVVPIHKKGDKSEPGNYRPVSLTSICSKLLEHIVLSSLNTQIGAKIHQNQHGFRKGLSCTTQLVTTLNNIMGAVDSGHRVHAAILDCAKAFDKVSHGLLITKLLKLDVDPSLVKWIASFLTNRSQRVVIDGAFSQPLKVTSGVPQGSVLGPTLFLVYINDAFQEINHSHMRLFADDVLLYKEIMNPLDVNHLQQDLHNLSNWADNSMMAFNVKKCQVVAFGTSDRPMYFLDNQQIPFTCSFTYLGVEISNTFDWSNHINNITAKALSLLGLLKRSLYKAPKKVKLIAYKSLCRPVLEYACEVWDPHLAKHRYQIECVQNKAVRFILDIRGFSGVTEGKQSLGLVVLEERRRNSRVRLLMKILADDRHSVLIDSFDQLSVSCRSVCTTRSASQCTPYVFQTNLNFYHHSFIPRTSRDLRLNSFIGDQG